MGTGLAFTPLFSKLAEAMKDYGEGIEIEPEHLFAPGIYVRILRMPKGSVIISKIHKTEHFCLALTGSALVVSDGGEIKERIVGPELIRTLPGTQRALYIEEDAIWITFHPTKETDLEKIESELIAEDFSDPLLLGDGT